MWAQTNISRKKMSQHFPDLLKNISTQKKKLKKITKKNEHTHIETAPKHLIFKILKTYDKEKNL